METYTEQVAEKLNHLLERTWDAKKGFENAAENATHVNLKSFLTRKATERNMFAAQLKALIGSYEANFDAEESGTIEGTMHRTWMDIKSAFGSDNEAVLEEAIRGEEKAIEDYTEVLQETSLTSQAKEILESQLSVIKSSLATVKNLEDAY